MSASNAKLLEIKQLASEKEILENFRWVPNMDRVREMSRRGPGKFYRIVAIHPMVTDPNNEGHGARRWTDEELKMATRTGIGKPLNLNHIIPITGGNNLAIDAEYEDHQAEALFYIEDSAIQQGIADKKLRTVSIQATAREVPIKCDGGACAVEPKGAVIYAWAIVTDEDFEYNGQIIPADKPGDPRSSIELLETLGAKGGHTDSSLRGSDGHSASEMADTTDSILSAINGLPNLTAESKTKLAELIKTGFGTAGGPAGASVAEVASLKGEVDAMKTQMNELKNSVTSVTGTVNKLNETLDAKLETSFNKVLNEKLKDFKPQGAPGAGAPPARPGVQTLETLGDTQLQGLMAAKLNETSLEEVFEFAHGAGSGQ